ncbi:hypothetical protein [Flavobacterium sp. 25HG05S-40]|uniref:hypothetical protein n=1 Tax=Flavobacterium sp. 25HG05S-40 TaxID=3458682 RepID=UPI004043C952
MNKILTLLVLATTLFSCSSSDDNVNTDSILQKVVFYRDSPNEKHWNIENGLLTNITLSDGTVVEEFVYDSQNRVINDTKYVNGIVSETNVITYTPNNTIQSINGLPYTFNATTRTYTYSYGSDFTINCVVNADQLAVDFVRMGSNAGEYHMSYFNGDMTSFKKVANNTVDVVKNFDFDARIGANPIYASVLAVARVKSLTDPNFFIDSVTSTNIAGGYDRGTSDPNYYSYGYTSSTTNNPTHNIKDFSIGIEVLDNSMNTVEFYSFAEYIHQF